MSLNPLKVSPCALLTDYASQVLPKCKTNRMLTCYDVAVKKIVENGKKIPKDAYKSAVELLGRLKTLRK